MLEDLEQNMAAELPSLWDHQKEAISKGMECNELLIAHQMGVGKTRTTIEILRRRCAQHQKLLKTVIFAPLIVLNNWRDEFLKYSKIPAHDILILNQSGKARGEKFYKAVVDPETGELTRGKIVITNYEAAQMKELMEQLRIWGPEVMVCDESHRCKSFESKRAEKVRALSEGTLYRYLLTGTPVLNTQMDLYMQFRILDGGATFGKNPWAFRNKWFDDENAGWSGQPNYFPKYVPRPQTFEEFATLVSKKMVVAKKSECLDLPEFVRVDREVEMSMDQTRMFNEMKKEYLTYIRDQLDGGAPRAVVAQLAITKALRLQQIVSGFAKDDTGSVHWLTPNPRIKALGDILEDLVEHHKVIVWSVFKENYKMIAELLKKMGIGYAELHGDIGAQDKDAMVSKFRKDPTCRVMVANQSAGGVGINMIEASYSIYYSRNFSLEADLQSEARNYRGGSEIHEKITRINLVAKDTIDELISESLANKQQIGDNILNWKG